MKALGEAEEATALRGRLRREGRAGGEVGFQVVCGGHLTYSCARLPPRGSHGRGGGGGGETALEESGESAGPGGGGGGRGEA